MRNGQRECAASSRQGSAPNSFHSVTTTSASAPSAAAATLGSTASPGTSSPARAPACGSYARTFAPGSSSRAASVRADASRRSSVPGLKASPSSYLTELDTYPPPLKRNTNLETQTDQGVTSSKELSRLAGTPARTVLLRFVKLLYVCYISVEFPSG